MPAVSTPAPGVLRVQARVDDGTVYPQTTYLEWDGKLLRARCDCHDGERCRHAIALALAFLDAPVDLPRPVAEVAGKVFLPGQDVILYGLWPAPPPKKLENMYRRPQCLWLALDTTRLREDGTPGAPRPMALWGTPTGRHLSDADKAILTLVTPFFQSHGRHFSSPHARGIPLLEDQVDQVLRHLAGYPFVFGAGRKPIIVRPELVVRHRRLSSWHGDEGIWELEGAHHPVTPGRVVGDDPAWVMIEDAFYPFSEMTLPSLAPADEGETEASLPPSEAASVTHPQVPPVPRLTLHEEGEYLLGRLGFVYGSATPVTAQDPRRAVLAERQGQWGHYLRDPQAEAALIKRLGEAGLDARADGDYLGWGDAALGFLMEGVPALIDAGWEVFGEERLSSFRVDRRRLSVGVAIATGTDWFDLETVLSLEDEVLPGASLRDALRANSRYIRLGSGAYARLPEEWLARQKGLSDALGVDALIDGQVLRQRLLRHQALLADEVLQAADARRADPDWSAFVELLRDFSQVAEVPVPETFHGELREYQRRGLDYLSFLADNGLNGILADDMGLGKTIQAIALLLREKAAGRQGPTLLVAPTSVVFNWEQELSRFAPDLKRLVLHGSGRRDLFEEIASADVVITSYSLLRRDFDVLSQQAFHYVILDEAQNIKNPRSQAAKFACRLSARHRLCLTGTPIENNLLELWSLFQFLMPGYLGSEKRFRRLYLSTEPGARDQRSDSLRRLTRPFILRRLKQEVATDLPPRSEMVTYCELGSEQRQFYDSLLSSIRQEVLGTVDRVGLAKSRFNVLEGLLRLRQACCDPQMVSARAAEIPSAKVELFVELVKQVVEEGHRVLVFSQFVKVLKILEKRLLAEGITYSYLDGQTKDRLERVERFNAGDTPVFLISLKAGGTGLNLTGADYVIHFDPWWNPAVEDQATDRAHRIGQTRHVFAYKLIAKDTVEEKVLALQQRKRQMVRDILGGEEMVRALSREDLEYLFS
ncbi:MAG TPA: SNF2-related protein [Pantanalinema sp.]